MQEQLSTRLAPALSAIHQWLGDHAGLTAPCRGGSSPEILFRRKCFNELCSYLIWLEHLGLAAAPAVPRLRAAVLAQFDEHYLELAGRSARQVLTFSASTALALRHRRYPPAVAARLAGWLGGPFSWQTELPAFRMLDLLAACDYAGVPAPVDYRQVLGISSLALPPDAILADRDGFYALTHTTLYGRLLHRGAPPAAPHTLAEIEAAIYRTLADQDTDLGLELAASALILDPRPGLGTSLLLEQVLGELAAAGVVDGERRPPSLAVEGFLAVQPEEVWSRAFHLMIVAGITLSLLSRLRAPVLAVADPALRQEIALLGRAMLLLHRYKLAPAVALLNGRERWSAPAMPVLAKIACFLEQNRNLGGGFGFFQLERQLLAAAGHPGLFNAEAMADIDRDCRRFLDHMPAHCAPA